MEACIGYFGIRDIGLFFKGYWDICVFCFWIWDIQEFWDRGYWNLFWDTSSINFGMWDILDGLFWDMGYCLSS